MSEGSLGSLPPIPDHRVSSQEGLASEICEWGRERVRSGNTRVKRSFSDFELTANNRTVIGYKRCENRGCLIEKISLVLTSYDRSQLGFIYPLTL